MAGNARRPGVSVVSRAIDVLTAFDQGHPRLTLTEIAHRADLPLATAHRLVGELAKARALTRTATGEYVVGRMLWDVGLLASVQVDLREVASPFLHDLYGATLANVHLAVREGTQVLYVDRIFGNRSVPIVSRVGSRLPMHSTGVGKVLLAHAPDEVRAEALRHLEQVTPFTVTQPARLRRQLDRVLAEGFATTSEEMSLGACSVAVPVHHRDGRVVASLGIVVATLRRDQARLVSALNVAARGVGRSLT